MRAQGKSSGDCDGFADVLEVLGQSAGNSELPLRRTDNDVNDHNVYDHDINVADNHHIYNNLNNDDHDHGSGDNHDALSNDHVTADDYDVLDDHHVLDDDHHALRPERLRQRSGCSPMLRFVSHRNGVRTLRKRLQLCAPDHSL